MFWRIIPPSSGHMIIHSYKYMIAMLVLIIVYCIIKNVKIQKLIKRINKTIRDKKGTGKEQIFSKFYKKCTYQPSVS
jgi:hypothetical protein